MPLNPVPNFPTSLDTLPDPTSANYTDDDGFELDLLLQKHNAILEAVEGKLGVGASTPVAGSALFGAATPGQALWTPLPRKNRLPNGLARHWTRGASGPATADNAYGPDAVRVLTETGATGYVIAQESSDVPSSSARHAFKLSIGASNNIKNGLFMPIEGVDIWDLRGQLVSIQCKLKVSDARIGDVRMALVAWTGAEDAISADPISVWGAALTNPTYTGSWANINTPASLAPTTSWATYKIESLTVPSGATNLALFIWIDDKTTTAGDYLLVTDCQVEKGAVCTDVERPAWSESLDQCRRYIRGWGGLALQVVGYGFATGATTGVVARTLSPPMRAIPAISFGSGAATNWAVQITGGTRVTLTALTVEASTGDGQDISLAITVAAGLTGGQGLRLIADNNAAARLYLSAEL